MDIQNVSNDGKFVAFFEQLKINTQRSRLRKGERPRDHPLPRSLVDDFLMRLENSSAVMAQSHILSTSQVPPAYAPCVLPINSLSPLMIKQMTLETHHRGRRALVRVMTPPQRMTAIMAIVEDEEGTATLLQLYNQPTEADVSKDHVLCKDDVLILKDPYFKAATDGHYSLRVDHVSDIVWLDKTDSHIPAIWRQSPPSQLKDSSALRQQGNNLVKKRDWAGAEKRYTEAIRAAQQPDEAQLAYLNRSLVNLRLKRFEMALSDAIQGTTDDTKHEKGLFRQAMALYSLGRFKDCCDQLLAVVRCNPGNTEAWNEIRRVKRRLGEQGTGDFDFASMYRQAKATPPIIDCATFIGPVVVQDSPGRGKGLFTTESVKAGDLLFAEKAFEYSHADNDTTIGKSNMTLLMSLDTNSMSMGGQANLINQIVQKLYHNPNLGKEFLSLHHGTYVPVGMQEMDGRPIVDSFLIARIIQLNCFGAPRSTLDSLKSRDSQTLEENRKLEKYSSTGFWCLASRINHSCVPNCHRSFIGDMLIVRACQDLSKGTELFHPYKVPKSLESFDDTKKGLSAWGFECDCPLCIAKMGTPSATIRQRMDLTKLLNAKLKQSVLAQPQQLKQAMGILGRLEATYSAGDIQRMDLWHPYFFLGNHLLNKEETMEGLKIILKGLRCLGFDIAACPPDVPEGGNGHVKPALEVKRWGYIHGSVITAFSVMARVYLGLSPELFESAKHLARTAYAARVGESDTFNLG